MTPRSPWLSIPHACHKNSMAFALVQTANLEEKFHSILGLEGSVASSGFAAGEPSANFPISGVYFVPSGNVV